MVETATDADVRLAQKHMSAFVGQFDLDDADGVNL